MHVESLHMRMEKKRVSVWPNPAVACMNYADLCPAVALAVLLNSRHRIGL